MIKLFKTTANLSVSEISSNGDLVIVPMKAVIHQAENSDFYLELETSLDYLNDFVYGYQIIADYFGTYEIFRVGTVTATRQRLKIKCPHITFDTDFMFWYDDPEIPGELPPREIGDRELYINDLNKALDFIYTPDTVPGEATIAFGRKRRIDLDTTAYPVSIRTVKITNGCSISEMANTLIKTYGGFIYRKKYAYKIIPQRITTQTQEVIEYGKNLTEISREEIDSEYATGILAIGTKKEVTPFGNADAFMARRVNFDQGNILADSYETQYGYSAALDSDLSAKASTYLSNNSSLKLNYTVKALIEDIKGIWDQVVVKDSKLGINITATVISFQYDLITEHFNEVIFGNYSESMSGYNQKMTDQFNKIRSDIPLRAFPVGTTVYYNNDLGVTPNNELQGYWTEISSGVWKRVV